MKSVDPKKLRTKMIKDFEEKLRHLRDWEWKILNEKEIQEKALICKGYLECLYKTRIIKVKDYRRLIKEKDYTFKKIAEHF